MDASSILRISLDEDDVAIAERIIADLDATGSAIEEPAFLQDIAIAAQELPRRLREGLVRFKLQERWPVCLVDGLRIDGGAIGPTPRDSMDKAAKARTRRQDIYLMLCCHLLGEAVAYATEHEGHLIHDVLPIAGNEGRQRGNSTDALHWHIEHAFHPQRMDYVALLCLRNDDQVATTFGFVDRLQIDDATRQALAQPAFPYIPDNGNRADGSNRLGQEGAGHGPADGERGLVAELVRRSYAGIQRMLEQPPRVPALFGGPALPYLRIHPHYVDDFGADGPSREAFDRLKAAIDGALEEVVLSPGQLLLIDNYRAVHGRRSIPGHYDGTDRWLKRAFVVRDLRKTRHLRISPADRVIY